MDGLSKYILARRLVRCSSSYHIFNIVTCGEDLYMPLHICANCGHSFYIYWQYIYCIRNVISDDIGHKQYLVRYYVFDVN